ncbi:uncharacterized protein LOC121524716 [Cheilinus undulatus]|uniref:uncharacterized protein LOC121524716 n=1 Tax=Cheilinus undulatus TaxID=241271 RepID=UPI001BD3CC81|nr:uncharacterized protein LOC121524716 [Cheilinus undulatus]
MSVRELLSDTLEDLGEEEFKKFKWCLQDYGIKIPKRELERADPMDTVDKIMGTYNLQSTDVVKEILEKMRRRDLVEELEISSSTGGQDQDKRDQNGKSLAKTRLNLPVAEASEVAWKMDSSCKFDKIICKELIHSGSPTVYQLTPKKDYIGTIRRLSFGEKDLNKTNRTVLLVGETDTGKSTMINALVNYDMGVTWEDNVWFKIVDKERSQFEGHTSDVIVYEIFDFEGKTLPYSLTVIDTPGFGDFRGVARAVVRERLFDLFRLRDGVHEINVVGLVLKTGCNGLSDRLRYILDSVVSLFGKDMERNIVPLITHSDGTKPKETLKTLEAANITCAKDRRNQQVHFLFNNCQNKDRTGDREALGNAFKTTTKGLTQFFEFLEKTAPQKIEKTVEVLNKRIGLRGCIQNLQERVKYIKLNQTEIQQYQEALKKREQIMKSFVDHIEQGVQTQEKIQQLQEALRKYELEMKSNENFIVEVDEPCKVKEPFSGGLWLLGVFYEGATCCTVCEENCHYPGCTVAWSPSRCEVMSKNKCTVCQGKCPVSDHVKEEWRYVTKTRKVQKTLPDMKEKYLRGLEECVKVKAQLEGLKKDKVIVKDVEEKFERIKSEYEDTRSILRVLEEEMEKHQRDKDQCLEESFRYVIELEKIALNIDSLSTLVHLDFLIEQFKEKGDTQKVQELEMIKKRVDEAIRALLESDHRHNCVIC